MIKKLIYNSFVLFFTLLLLTSITSQHNTAQATCVCCCAPSCVAQIVGCDVTGCTCASNDETEKSREHVTDEFIAHREWLITVVFRDHVLPAMMLMTNQISTVAMHQTMVIGSFFDAKHQLESQRLLQELQAQAHKDYQPSVDMCRVGTSTRSLAAADGNLHFNHIALAARNTQRVLMNAGAIGTGAGRDDSRSRLAQFRGTYCNPADFGAALDLLCTGGDVARRNKDINYTHAIQGEDTLLVDFSDFSDTDTEEDVLALSANLYGHRLLPAIPQLHIANDAGSIIVEGATVYMKTRALQAKRSVAFNSFAAQTAMRSQGGETVAPFMTEYLESMGMPADAIESMLKGKPSYNAQMEVLTKKLHQFPTYYSDLYDKPVNVDRNDTAMQAIALMQKRDMYRSQLRMEASTAVWLETLVEDLQEFTTNEAKALTEGNEILLDLGL